MKTIAVICKDREQFTNYIQSVPSENMRVMITDYVQPETNFIYDDVIELELFYWTIFAIKLKPCQPTTHLSTH